MSAKKRQVPRTELLNLLNGQTTQVFLDGSLARGLDYYTGCIFEVIPTEVCYPERSREIS